MLLRKYGNVGEMDAHVRVEVCGASATNERAPFLDDELLSCGLCLTDCGWHETVIITRGKFVLVRVKSMNLTSPARRMPKSSRGTSNILVIIVDGDHIDRRARATEESRLHACSSGSTAGEDQLVLRISGYITWAE